MKKVNTCAVGGFVALRNLLLSPDCTSDILETLKCRACRELLESSSFSFDTLQLEVSKAPDKFSPTCTSANLAAETCPAPAPAPMESDPRKKMMRIRSLMQRSLHLRFSFSHLVLSARHTHMYAHCVGLDGSQAIVFQDVSRCFR